MCGDLNNTTNGIDSMTVWIDLDNSPHVHFFAPIIRRLKYEGIEPVVTVRSFSQTEELANSYGLTYIPLGKHRTPRHTAGRIAATVERAWQLARYVPQRKPRVAISHGSRALSLAAWQLRIPTMTLYDYEFVSSRFFSIVSDKILVPIHIPIERLQAQGVDVNKGVRYPGFKEEVYIWDFRPSPAVLSELALDPARLIVTLRPPATWAHYHDELSEVLLKALVARLSRESSAQVVCVTRTEQQEVGRAHV